jgi:hypothetical protein
MRRGGIIFTAIFIVSALLPSAASAAAPVTSVWTLPSAAAPAAALSRFDPFDGTTGASVAAADLGEDGIDELLFGSPPGVVPEVRIHRADGSLIKSFPVFDKGMLRGVDVEAGDVDGDGRVEIVVAAGNGTNGHVSILDLDGKIRASGGGFFPFGSDFRGGSRLAMADIDRDGKSEIMVTPIAGDPVVRIFSADGAMIAEFIGFEGEIGGGLHLAAGDLDGDGFAEIVVARAVGGDGSVRFFNGRTKTLIREFRALGDAFNGGLTLALVDATGDGTKEVLAAPASGGGPQVRLFDFGGRVRAQFFVAGEDDHGGLELAAGVFGQEKRGVVAVPNGVDPLLSAFAQYIDVDNTEQRLRAYEYGKVVRTFLVSTGKVNKPTPLGSFTVLAKPFKVLYRGTGYDYGWVPWNLRFKPSYYIHYAPWHFDFGRRRSSGCVNVDRANAEWIYNWANVGTPVNVHI